MGLRLSYSWVAHRNLIVKHPIREQPTQPLAVRAAPSLIRELNHAAQQTGASRSRLVRSFIEQGLKRLPKD